MIIRMIWFFVSNFYYYLDSNWSAKLQLKAQIHTHKHRFSFLFWSDVFFLGEKKTMFFWTKFFFSACSMMMILIIFLQFHFCLCHCCSIILLLYTRVFLFIRTQFHLDDDDGHHYHLFVVVWKWSTIFIHHQWCCRSYYELVSIYVDVLSSSSYIHWLTFIIIISEVLFFGFGHAKSCQMVIIIIVVVFKSKIFQRLCFDVVIINIIINIDRKKDFTSPNLDKFAPNTKKNEEKDQKITIVSSSRLMFICSICVQKKNDEYKIKTTAKQKILSFILDQWIS